MLKCFPELEPQSTRASCDTQDLCCKIYFLLETYQHCSMNIHFFACLSVGGTPNSLLAFTFGPEVVKEKRQEAGKKRSLLKQYLGMSDLMLQPMIFPYNGDLCYCVCGIITKTDFFFNGTINRIFPGLLCIFNRIFTSPLGSERKESKCQKAGALPILQRRGCNHV